MSLIKLEGFEIDRHQTLQGAKHGECSSMNFATPGRLGWGYYAYAFSGNYTLFLGTQYSTLIAGAAVQFTDTDVSEVFQFRKDGAAQVTLLWSGGASRRLQVRRGSSSGTILADVTTYEVPMNAWLYIEIKVAFHDTAGAFELRVNGSTIASGTGLDTLQNGSGYEPNQVHMDMQQDFDDLYVCDDSGSQWNDFQGEIAIEGVLPNSDGSNSDFTPQGGGANYVEVDEDGDTDDDTTYTSSSTAGHKDTFDHPNLIQTGGTILGVAVSAWARKDDAGSRNARALLRSNTTEQTGNTEICSDSWTHLETLAEVDPDTAAAWTETGVNAAEPGYELVS